MESSDDETVNTAATNITPRTGSNSRRGSASKHRPRPPPKTAPPPDSTYVNPGPVPRSMSPGNGPNTAAQANPNTHNPRSMSPGAQQHTQPRALSPGNKGTQPGSRPGSSARPPPKSSAQLSARSKYNFSSLSKRDKFVFGAERPGYVRPDPNQTSTPRGPSVPTGVVEMWCESMKAAGIKRVLSLLNEAEMSFYNENLIETYGRYFAEVNMLPQNSSATLTTVLEAFKAAEDFNEPIVVHCSTGQGRTGTILALWLHHRYSLPIPAAVTECMEHASFEGAIRKPSIEALMQLLLGSAQRILPHIRNLQPERENGQLRGQTPRVGQNGGVNGSVNATPSATPRLDSKLNVTFIQTGGTIDKDYPRSSGGYAFEITDPAVERILNNVEASFSWEIETACKKDSTEINNEDRGKLIDMIEKSECMRFIITHGSDTLIETAKFLDRAGLSVGKVVVLCAAMRPEHFRNSDAHFNVGVAMGAINVLWSGVYVAMGGRVVEASRATRDSRTGLFNVK